MKLKTKTNQPLVSVVMPVYNTAEFVAAAIESIVKQSYKNWELIVVDDASTDDSWKIIQRFAKKNKRIKALRNSKNLGVASTANRALKLISGQFLARMDSDDIALLNRLAKQVVFLQKHPEYVAIGGQCQVIDEQNRVIGRKRFPTNPKQVKDMAFYWLSIQQPAMMINRALLPKKFSWYQSGVTSGEEHELIFKLFTYGLVGNLKEVVLRYRLHSSNICRVHPKQDFRLIFKTRWSAIQKYSYRPSFKAVLLNLSQFIAIGVILPEGMIYPLYLRLRGLKPLK
jgi:glycosyltransferase involved in cell wall biosynthesis